MIKQFLKDKAYGFYATMITFVLSILTAIVYGVGFGSTVYMSWAAFALLFVGIVVAVIFIAIKQMHIATELLLVANLLSFLLFVYNIYFFVSSVLTGIQFSGFPPQFFAVVIFYGLTLVASVACVFMPMAKKEQ